MSHLLFDQIDAWLPNASPLLWILLLVFGLSLLARLFERWSRWPGFLTAALLPIAAFPVLEEIYTGNSFEKPPLELAYTAAAVPVLLAAAALVNGHSRHAHAMRSAALLMVAAGLSTMLLSVAGVELQALFPHAPAGESAEKVWWDNYARLRRDYTTMWTTLAVVLASLVYALVQQVARRPIMTWRASPTRRRRLHPDVDPGARGPGVALLAITGALLLTNALLDLAWLQPGRALRCVENPHPYNDEVARYIANSMIPTLQRSVPALRGAMVVIGALGCLLLLRELLRRRRAPAPALLLAAVGLTGLVAGFALKLSPTSDDVERVCSISRGAIGPWCHAHHGVVPRAQVHRCALLHESPLVLSDAIVTDARADELPCAVEHVGEREPATPYYECNARSCRRVRVTLYATSVVPGASLADELDAAPAAAGRDAHPQVKLVLPPWQSSAAFASLYHELGRRGVHEVRFLVRGADQVLHAMRFGLDAQANARGLPRVSLRRDAPTDAARVQVWVRWPGQPARRIWAETAGDIVDALLRDRPPA